MKSSAEAARAFLILGRISNLPTVWSNLTAGWLLAGGWEKGSVPSLTLLLFGGSFLYIGGMYLNDWCDTAFDSRHRSERPIPSGRISRNKVGLMTAGWFVLGLACLTPLGWLTSILATLLLAAIVLYDFHHKNVPWAPFLMGFCRFLLYLLAASVVDSQIPLFLLICAAALGFYVAGITYIARGESQPGKPFRWGFLLLLCPLVVLSNRSFFFVPAPLLFCLLFLGWLILVLIPFWRKTDPFVGRVVSGLLAGIVLVDALLVSAFSSNWLAAALLPFLLLALLLQRSIPAT
ncbi:MAG: UbiA family prenyltransferase [Methylacidiphilales bacterium]|nr:UbiA family prenyltransferase [Candidatus Methylacidiphilales bacterium]